MMMIMMMMIMMIMMMMMMITMMMMVMMMMIMMMMIFLSLNDCLVLLKICFYFFIKILVGLKIHYYSSFFLHIPISLFLDSTTILSQLRTHFYHFYSNLI